jgi:tRNA-binding protein
METITWEHFQQVDLRVGTIERAEPFPQARKPAYRIWVNLGPDLGIKQSSAQLTDLYSPESLLGRQVLCVVNFPPKQIANFLSEILVTGFILPNGTVVLPQPDRPIPNGTRLA